MKLKKISARDYAAETGEPILSLEELIREIEAYKPLWQPSLRVKDALRAKAQGKADRQASTESILRIWGV